MQNVMREYKGVILLFLVLVLVGFICNSRIKELNNQDSTNQVSIYEK